MRFGVHVSIQGSIAEAPRRALELGRDCFQMSAGPPRNWRRRLPGAAEVERFRSLLKEHDLRPVAVHAGYLVHLVSPKRRVARGSAQLLRKEVEIAAAVAAIRRIAGRVEKNRG